MNHNEKIRSKILGPQHKDIKYLMQDHIGIVISKGLADTFENRPKNPIEHFAKWLLNYRQTQRRIEQVSRYHFMKLHPYSFPLQP